MSDARSRPVFLERAGYRRRRMADAAVLLPIFGTMLFAVPMLWPRAVPDGDLADAGTRVGHGAQDAVSMSEAIVYIFGVWFLLILLAALFGMRVRQWALDRQEPEGR